MNISDAAMLAYLSGAALVTLYTYLVRKRMQKDEIEMMIILGFVPVVGVVVAVYATVRAMTGFFAGALKYYRRRNGSKP